MERSGMFSATLTSLSTVTKRCSEDKILYLHITPPLTKPSVGGSAISLIVFRNPVPCVRHFVNLSRLSVYSKI